MSHFLRCKLSLKNKSVIKRALTRMGLPVEEGKFTVGRYGQSEQVDLLLEKELLGLQQQTDGTFLLVGDPYYCKNAKLRTYYNNVKRFDTDLKVSYGIIETTEQLEMLGYTCTENSTGTVGHNGKIKMEFSKLYQ